ncbi:MAG: M15 family metallopeptidase [Pseudonocardiales bacterium]|nr:M15 family metallopeptidase [Pseudonocardiales bacterium]
MSGHGAAYQQVPAAQQTPAAAFRMPAAQPKTAPRQVEPWIVGATVLPRRRDGYGVVRSTPPALVNRQLPTIDRLPPPTSNAFASTIAPVGPDVLARSTWKPVCPVKPEQLRYLTMSFRGFDARAHTGEMLINAEAAQTVVDVFKKLFTAGFPVEDMRISPEAELNLPPTGDHNNTEGFICRPKRGQTQWPAQAFGLAINLNPFHNPYVSGDLVVPELASSYLARDWKRSGMVSDGGPAVTAFESAGWKWGGRWPGPVNFAHFSTNGH